MEAMDESAEWRLRYDKEVDRTKKCLQELQVVFNLLFGFSLSTLQSELKKKDLGCV